MFPPCWKRVVLLLATVSLTGLACTKNPEVAPADKAGAAPTPTAAPTTPAQPPAKAPAAAEGNPLAGIPGMDFSALPPTAQRELATVFSDEFCYCGCPHTLGACLKQHTGCRHAKRMARLSAMSVADGMPATEVIVSLSRYYATFRERRVELKVDPRMCMGDANAPVTLAEFSDFECPFCAKARPILEDFAKKNPQVRFCYLPFPLPGHANAIPAGQAALWARDQGKFWEMHDALFMNQQNLSPAALPALAEKIGLSGAKLQEVLKAGTYVQELESFKAMGRAANISGTPALFFNGRTYSLGLEPEQLAHSVEDEIEWRTHNNAWGAD
ncbi:DsbA family protein [Hyalangium rubrum]|uniref:Thioredoxin domain-containing protein n=1 Tax=Hyalangium rubrum TaxID=3103134 RepID=A0ABU5HAL4_9BACT|nr:thioredoxin domain-containing protein [Hyalangium sp. s54d21]MDY7230510.1 thioredoxin domain-containing protein [Hyalangium sp. s54d21]